MPSRTSSLGPPPPHPASNNGDSRRASRSMLQNSKPAAGAKAAATLRLGASHDLPSSVTHFLCLSSTSNSAAAKKELRRQLLVLRDYCVGASNKTKGKELLSQGGKSISRKVEATPDFNSCLDVIFATSLVFTEETEDVAKDTLRGIITKLKAVQDCGDEKAFRAAIVEVVNRILLCTPLLPPAKDAKAAAEHEEQATAAAAAAAAEADGEEAKANGKQKHHSSNGKRHQQDGEEPRLRDECLDFLTMEDGAPVLVEGRWKRWLDYYESGYVRYVETLMAEQAREQQNGAAAASDAEDDEGEDAANEDAPAAAAPLVESVPFFTARQNYWKSTTSAYAQFCYLLLAIYFVRTKDFSLNYLARVNKLVQYYAYQLDAEDGEPIAVKEGPVEEESEADESEAEESEEEEEEPEEAQEEPEEAARGNEAGVQTEQQQEEEPEPQSEPQPEEEEEPAEEEEEVTETARSLPPPQFDDSVIRRTRHSPRHSAPPPEHASSVSVAPEPVKAPRRRTHKCFTTEQLPAELRPTAADEEEAAAEAQDTEAHSHVPVVRRTTKMDIADVATSQQRERESAEVDSAKKAIQDARDEAAVEALAKEAAERNELEEMAAEAEEADAEAELAEGAEEERVAKTAEELRSEAVVEGLAQEAEAHDALEKMASESEVKPAETELEAAVAAEATAKKDAEKDTEKDAEKADGEDEL